MKWNELNEASGYDVVDGNGVLKKYHDVIKSYVAARGGKPIFRGMKNTGTFVLGDGDSVNKKSANTFNYYTLITDNDPTWESFPDRSKSFICTTNSIMARSYGTLYVAIPLESQNIGVCPHQDWWESFGDPNPSNVNEAIRLLSTHAKIMLSETNIKTFIEQLNEVSNVVSNDVSIKIPYNLEEIGYERGSSLYDAYVAYLNPINNGFVHTHNIETISDRREVWMSGLVLFIDATVYFQTIVPMIEKELSENVNEGVNDKHIFKAIFTAGGPGSGKTTISKKLLSHKGFKEVNVDRFIEFLASKNDLDLKNMDSWDRNVKSKAHSLNKSQLDLYIDGRLPLIIDGTGRNYDKIITLSNDLKKLGYETGLLFVNTDMETAIERNSKRSCTVANDVVETIWRQTQANLGRFQNYFGNNLFIVDSSNTKLDLNGVAKRIDSFINSASKSPAATKWMNSQKNLTELFDTPVKKFAKNTGDNKYHYYNFNVGKKKYFIEFTKSNTGMGNSNDWSMAYGYENTKDIYVPANDSKDGIKVLGTVVNYVSKFLNDVSPDTLKFSGNNEYGLKTIYVAMAKNLKKRLHSLGYVMSSFDLSDDITSFIIHKDAAKIPDFYGAIPDKKSNPINELFDTDVETTVTKRGYNFTVDDVTYNIRMIAGDEILFSLAGDDSNSYLDKKNIWNNSVKVFSAVYNVIKSKFTPPYKFAANLDESSRVKLYDVLSKRLATNLDLNLKVVDKYGERFYYFTNNLNELFDTSADIDLAPGKRNDPGGGIIHHDEGKFTFNGIDYFLRFTPSPRYVEVDYGFVNPEDDKQGASFKPSNTLLKDAPKVLGIVKNRIKKYIIENKPNMLFFAGDKSNGLAKLYSAMGKKLAAEFKDLGYELHENNLPRSVFFRLKKVPITETSSAGATGAGNVATSNGNVGGLGVGFDPDGDWGIYEFAKKKRKR